MQVQFYFCILFSLFCTCVFESGCSLQLLQQTARVESPCRSGQDFLPCLFFFFFSRRDLSSRLSWAGRGPSWWTAEDRTQAQTHCVWHWQPVTTATKGLPSCTSHTSQKPPPSHLPIPLNSLNEQLWKQTADTKCPWSFAGNLYYYCIFLSLQFVSCYDAHEY